MDKFKKFAYFIIILFCIMFFSSCESKIKNVPTETDLDGLTGLLIENNAVDFYFYYPENWIIHRNDSMIIININDEEVMQTDATEPDSNENLIIMSKPNLSAQAFTLPDGKYETTDDYWEKFAVPSFEELFQDVTSEAEKELTVDGVPAKKYSYTLSCAGMKYQISQVIFFNKLQVYILTYTATESRYSTYASVLDTAAETFKFK